MVLVSELIAIGNIGVAAIIFFMFFRVLPDLRGSRLLYPGILLALGGLMFVFHALSEVFGLGENVYAITASVVSFLLLGAIYLINRGTEVI